MSCTMALWQASTNPYKTLMQRQYRPQLVITVLVGYLLFYFILRSDVTTCILL